MNSEESTRREFLIRATTAAALGAGAATIASTIGTAAAASATPLPVAEGQEAQSQGETPMHVHMSGDMHGAFFNYTDAVTIAAFSERLMPGAPGRPGALDVGVLNYIDLALAGAYSDLQDFYRSGLAQLDAYCRQSHGKGFSELGAAQQDEVLMALDEGKASGFAWPSAQAFFNMVWLHTIEGMWADPIYGGNKDFAGWRLVGFPGAQAVFGPADMKSTQAFTRAPLIGLQAQSKTPLAGQ